jgi:hypothetical protein
MVIGASRSVFTALDFLFSGFIARVGLPSSSHVLRMQKNAHPEGCAFRRSRCPIGCAREYAVQPVPFPYPRPPDRGRRPCRRAQDDEALWGLEEAWRRRMATCGSLSGS